MILSGWMLIARPLIFKLSAMEKWLPINGYEGLYEISNMGRIRRLPKMNIIAKCEHVKGYLLSTLWKKSKQKTFTVHRLVAIHFLSNPESKPQVNHIDGNKKNNNVSNLEWCTASHNIIHSVANGTFKRSTKSFTG